MTQTYETLRVERDGAVAEVVLARPQAGNALCAQTFADLEEAFAALDADPEVRVAILRAEGKAFCYGLDLLAAPVDFAPVLTEGLAGERMELRALVRQLQRQTAAPARFRRPVVAAIHGWCIGGGLDLAAACDLRLCAADARFSLREARVGMVADLGSLQRLPRIIGDAATRELAFTAKDIDAARAERLGLVSEVCPTLDDLLVAARREAAAIAALSPLVTAGLKHVLAAQDGRTVEEGLEYVATWNSAFLQSEDLREAFASFLEKRPPAYRGR